MDTAADRIRITVNVAHRSTGWPLSGVEVAAVERAAGDADAERERIVATGVTTGDGAVVLEIDDRDWLHRARCAEADGLAVHVVDGYRDAERNDRRSPYPPAVPLTAAMLAGEEEVQLEVQPSGDLPRSIRSLVADALVATRRVRVGDVAADLADPPADSLLRTLRAADRVHLLDELIDSTGHEASDVAALLEEHRIVDPDALREGELRLDPPPRFDLDAHLELDRFDPDRLGREHLGNPLSPIWDRFPWTLPDDQSYRDYLRGVFVLFAHQQKSGATTDASAFPSVVERQLARRFFQDFRTTDRTEQPLNRLLIAIVRAILTAPTGSGFGFGVASASLPNQDARTDREYLDVLLALAPVDPGEFANRYRLPLREPDSTISTPVLLNVHTLSHVLSDTAQGPVEPPENVIEPQLPGIEGKPILWTEVVGSAPFFLRFDEWLNRQQPFFPENLFAIRTQVNGTTAGAWLNEDRKKFLEFHKAIPSTWGVTPYQPYFGSIGEVHRSAEFLLEYGAADAKLTELVQAIDRNQFQTASRLADEAEQLLVAAAPSPVAGEDWEPEKESGNFPRPLSFARRRKVKVSTITELTGNPPNYPPDGFERFYQLPRPIDIWLDIVHFRNARDTATRLRTYQQRFVLPMLRAVVRVGLGDIPGAVDVLEAVTGFFIGVGMLGTPAGMTRHPDAFGAKRAVGGRLRWSDPLGDRPYTARLMYDAERRLDGPFPLTPQVRNSYDVTKPDPSILHPFEERYARIVQADALLAWAETLYRTDDAALLERARELYKAVVYLHGEDPGTSAYVPVTLTFPNPAFVLGQNPRVRNQLDRARLALHQLDAGLNFYGYSDDAVPTLRYQALVGAAHRWATGAKSAQGDYLDYLGHVEHSDLDMLTAKAQERKAQSTVAIAAEQIEIAKAGVVVAQKLVTGVEKLIEKKKQENADANSIFSQFKDYFSGMKSSVSSIVDVGKDAKEGATALGLTTDAEIKVAAKQIGSEALTGTGVAGGLAVVGGFAAFAVLSTMTLQGMADAATQRDNELKALQNEALPAARAAVRVQERVVTIARLQGEIAATDLQYARDLVAYQNERFLNRDFWDALAGVARRALHRYLDLAGQSAWFAERALAYQLASPIRIIRLGYFDPRMRDLGAADRLALDLAELEAVRLGAARVTVPITRTYSLARDLPLAFGALKREGRCTFALSDDDLAASHPGTFAHRIRAVDVFVEAPGTVARPRGILTNRGFSLLRRAPGANRVPLLRFADAYPVSEFRVRSDLALHGMPGEQLLPFEGSAFTTTWTLELPPAANPTALARVTDVLITFDLQAGYDAGRADAATPPAPASRSLFVSALSVDTNGLSSLRTAPPVAKVRFSLDELPVPADAKITNLAVLIPGVDDGRFNARLRVGGGVQVSFPIEDGLAMSNVGVLSDGDPTHALPLNAATGASPGQAFDLEITKGADADLLAAARDVLLWIEYEVTA